ncbi:MAG: hypothetical protein ACREDM_12740 [Methylocella sp.]
MEQNFILSLPERQTSICRAHQRNMRRSVESMNVAIHLEQDDLDLNREGIPNRVKI